MGIDALPTETTRAAMYVRMSTEHQQYSIQNQVDGIEAYARRNGLEIVKRFTDHGKSGVTLKRRIGLQSLLKEVESEDAEFDAILVYDVSRWGRFQDVDESAYYEYICKRAAVGVHYCAEPFRNDGSLSSDLIKSLKRSMAAEYSRELSVKVFAGKARLIEMGFRQGGLAGLGLRRLLVGPDGKPKQILNKGDRKSIQTDRVILIPGPDDEVRTVRDIFNLYTVSLLSAKQIALHLNKIGVKTDRGRPWSHVTVNLLLSNPKYTGSNTFNRLSCKLSKKAVHNPRDMWIRCDGAFEAIISPGQFAEAEQIRRARTTYPTNEQLLQQLNDLWNRKGYLTAKLIQNDASTASVNSIQKRFKSLSMAYNLIGYRPDRTHKYERTRIALRDLLRNICEFVKAKLRELGATVENLGYKCSMLINGEFTVTFVLCTCIERPLQSSSWTLGFRKWLPDITVAVRLKEGNTEILDFFLFPGFELSEMATERLHLTLKNKCHIDVYRWDNLDPLFSLATRRILVQI